MMPNRNKPYNNETLDTRECKKDTKVYQVRTNLNSGTETVMLRKKKHLANDTKSENTGTLSLALYIRSVFHEGVYDII